MKLTYNIAICLLLSLFCLMQGSAQEAKIKRANKIYDAKGFIDATDIYLKVAKKGYRSKELLTKLANSYYFNANYEDAGKWYTELFKITEDLQPIYYLRYSQSLRASKQDSVATVWYNKFLDRFGQQTDDFAKAGDYIDIIEKSSNRYTIEPLSINSNSIDFGATYYGDYLVFASTRDTGKIAKKRSSWTNLPFLDLYKVKKTIRGLGSTPTKLFGKKSTINTAFNECSPVFTNNGKTMYFTANNFSPKLKQKSKELQHLKIYRATLIEEQWQNIEDLTINGDNYSTAHPAMGPKGDKLYYVSDMPGGEGQTDLYYVDIYPDGTLGKPINMGKKVNTKGRESFPYITKNNELYFSSDGHFGLGGYDIFYVNIKDKGYVGSIINVGTPVNSSFDDFAFVKRNNKGYFSSNRNRETLDDIYSFKEIIPIQNLFMKTINGLITDSDTNRPLKQAKVIITDSHNNIISETLTNDDGHFNIGYQNFDGSPKTLTISSNSYYTYSELMPENKKTYEIELNKVTDNQIVNGMDIAESLNVVIYFDFDEYDILPESELELQKIVETMKLHPGIKLEIISHTDSRGSNQYNLELSNNRAYATLNYLIDKGISANRLTAKGYGNTQPVNHCNRETKCTEEEHAKNRRSQFLIISY